MVGEGFRFGYKAAGDTAALQRLGTELGIAIKVVDLVQLAAAADNKPISSSTVSHQASDQFRIHLHELSPVAPSAVRLQGSNSMSVRLAF